MTLSIQSLNKGYGITSPVLFDISFELEKGSVTGVLGKNGIGKSTLLRSIAQLEPIQNGKILWDGNPLKKDDVSFVLLSDYYYKNKTVQTVVKDFQLLNDHFEIEKTYSLLQDVKIDFQQKIHTMSTGTRQKFEIALTLGKQAKIYLFDEPFSNVDFASRSDIKQMLQMNGTNENILILTTNILENMDTLLTDAVILNHQKATKVYNLEKVRETKCQSLKQIYLEETR
ncbi:ATP-binding cassette domain-containing protein [Enterococcus faecalis]|uniref:ATP-binding cassette domain-containing protein n=1 Tax=Enterococcus faecalis TaxID=1351 RepID=UPI00287FEA69|nr:ATP-binding cassette domain-containing protein [Enterococcus faecalis]